MYANKHTANTFNHHGELLSNFNKITVLNYCFNLIKTPLIIAEFDEGEFDDDDEYDFDEDDDE